MKPLDTFELEPGIIVELYHDPEVDETIHADILEDLRKGKIDQYVVFVKAMGPCGLYGYDSLGGVLVGYDDHKQEIRDAIDQYDMVDEAREHLKQVLDEVRTKLSGGGQ